MKRMCDTKTHLSLDMEKIREYVDLMGYYTLITSETEKPDREIINKYHGLSRIEDSFRITKTDLEGRPVYVRKPEHINAHFPVCFIALTMMRIIQYKVLKHHGKDTLNKDGWESGVTAERIKKALGSFQADAVPGGYYRLTKPNDDMRLILDSLGVEADLQLPTASDLSRDTVYANLIGRYRLGSKKDLKVSTCLFEILAASFKLSQYHTFHIGKKRSQLQS